MKIFKVMPIFAALIALSACPTAPNGEGGTPAGPDVVLKPGDNADESGNIKPEAGSPTTKEFLALFNKGFRGTDLKTLAVKEEGGAYTVTINLFGMESVATLDSLKSPTLAIFRMEMPIDDAGTVTATQYIGIVVDQKTVWQLEWLNDYESEYPGNGASDAQKKAFYDKAYAKENINWEDRQDILAALPPAPADVSAFVAKVNGLGFKYEKFDPSGTTLEPFSLKSDGSFNNYSRTYKIFYFEDENTVWYVNPDGGGASAIRLDGFRLVELNENSGDSIIAAKPDPALLSQFVAKVNAAGFKYIKNDQSGTTLEPFTIKADGSFEMPNYGTPTAYKIFYFEDENTAKYLGDRIHLEPYRLGNWHNNTMGNVIAAKPNPALLSQFVAKVNAAALWSSSEQFTLNADGSYTSGGSTSPVFYMLNDTTANYINGERGLRGNKFGDINYNYGDGGSKTEGFMTSLLAVLKSDTDNPSALPALKASLAGIYKPFVIDYSGGSPTTNYGDPFTINADGGFTGAQLQLSSYEAKKVIDGTLHSARSAAEGRYIAKVDSTDSFIGIEIHEGILYVSSLYGSVSSIDTISWLSLSPVAKKQ